MYPHLYLFVVIIVFCSCSNINNEKNKDSLYDQAIVRIENTLTKISESDSTLALEYSGFEIPENYFFIPLFSLFHSEIEFLMRENKEVHDELTSHGLRNDNSLSRSLLNCTTDYQDMFDHNEKKLVKLDHVSYLNANNKLISHQLYFSIPYKGMLYAKLIGRENSDFDITSIEYLFIYNAQNEVIESFNIQMSHLYDDVLEYEPMDL